MNLDRQEVISILSVLGQILKSGVSAELQSELEAKISEYLKKL